MRFEKSEVRYFVGSFHVSTPDAEIVAELDKRTEGWPYKDQRDVRRFALTVHHARSVMS